MYSRHSLAKILILIFITAQCGEKGRLQRILLTLLLVPTTRWGILKRRKLFKERVRLRKTDGRIERIPFIIGTKQNRDVEL